MNFLPLTDTIARQRERDRQTDREREREEVVRARCAVEH